MAWIYRVNAMTGWPGVYRVNARTGWPGVIEPMLGLGGLVL